MRPELQAIVDEFDAATARLHALRQRLPDEQWGRRPAPERWSVGECVAHLNLTSAAFLGMLRPALDEARRSGHTAPRRYRRDPLGWFLWSTLGPPVRFKVKTSASFVPRADRPPGALLDEFERLQDAQVAATREADGLPITHVKIASPFDARVTYNVFSALSVLPRHQHRHLWQAEQTLAQPAAGRPSLR